MNRLHSIVTFLNHGILPFVGREREVARVVDFWRGAAEEHRLRAMLVSAEAGMGKSRLADEAIAQVEREGGAVVSVRFYPDASLSIAPLMSRALRSTLERKGLAVRSSEPSSNGSLLRRLIHLRPTLLVLEDIHLLAGSPLRELQELLAIVADLPLSLLLPARPIELSTRGVLEPFLVEELTLAGIDTADVHTLVQSLFGSSLAEWFPLLLHEVTVGNPLALRSALRSAITSGAIVDAADGSWRVTRTRDDVSASLVRGVQLLTEGMVAHVGHEERRAAEQLAELGEVFAARTARAIIPDADARIGALLFHGVISPLELPISPLLGERTNDTLYAFSHTLLHRSLTGRGGLRDENVIAALAAGHPFYSIAIIDAITRMEPASIDDEILRASIVRLLDAANLLDTTTDWQLAPALVAAAGALFARQRESLPEDLRHELELRLVQSRLATMHRDDASEEHERLIDQYVRATDEPLPLRLREHRIAALRLRCFLEFRRNSPAFRRTIEEIESYVECHPQLISSYPYLLYMRTLAGLARVDDDVSMVRMVEQRIAAIESRGLLDEKLERFLDGQIRLRLLPFFDTCEELEARRRLLAKIESQPDHDDTELATLKSIFLHAAGHIEEFLEITRRWLPRYEKLGLMRYAVQARMAIISESGAFGGEIARMIEEEKALIASAPEHTRERLRMAVYSAVATQAIFRGELELMGSIVEELHHPEAFAEDELRLLIALAVDDNKEIERLATESEGRPAWRALATLLFDGDGTARTAAIDAAREELRQPIVRLDHLMRRHALLTLTVLLRDGGDTDLEGALLPDIKAALEETMEWLRERELHLYMRALLRRYRGWFGKRSAEGWSATANRIARERAARQSRSATHDRIRITMLDSIEVEHPGVEAAPIRGSRLRILLGLLVADAMMTTRLGHREFCRIVAGDDDIERGRKTMNGVVMRLREAIGVESVTTDEETPRLNLALVSVDLLEAMNRCDEADEAMRARSLAHAMIAARRSLEIWNSRVPFPGLYESIFEAAREDFENRVRATTLRVARALLDEEDPLGSDALLGDAMRIMPGDDGIVRLRIEALDAAGRRAEAEALRNL